MDEENVPPVSAPKKAPVQAVKRKKRRKGSLPWNDIRDQWILSRIDGNGKPVSKEELAQKYKISRQGIYNRASVDKWTAQLAAREKEKVDFLATTLKESSDMAIKNVQNELSTNETDVRIKHTVIARALQGRAIKFLTGIPLDRLTPRDALLMLKIGLEEERKALGLPDSFIKTETDVTHHPEYRGFVQQIDNHKELQAKGLELLKRMRDRKGPITDETTDADILVEVGLQRALPEGEGGSEDEEGGEDGDSLTVGEFSEDDEGVPTARG